MKNFRLFTATYLLLCAIGLVYASDTFAYPVSSMEQLNSATYGTLPVGKGIYQYLGDSFSGQQFDTIDLRVGKAITSATTSIILQKNNNNYYYFITDKFTSINNIAQIVTYRLCRSTDDPGGPCAGNSHTSPATLTNGDDFRLAISNLSGGGIEAIISGWNESFIGGTYAECYSASCDMGNVENLYYRLYLNSGATTTLSGIGLGQNYWVATSTIDELVARAGFVYATTTDGYYSVGFWTTAFYNMGLKLLVAVFIPQDSSIQSFASSLNNLKTVFPFNIFFDFNNTAQNALATSQSGSNISLPAYGVAPAVTLVSSSTMANLIGVTETNRYLNFLQNLIWLGAGFKIVTLIF